MADDEKIFEDHLDEQLNKPEPPPPAEPVYPRPNNPVPTESDE